jgi:hypothetical protein
MDITIRFNENHPKYKALIQLLADEGHTVTAEVRPVPQPELKIREAEQPEPEQTPQQEPEDHPVVESPQEQRQEEIQQHLDRPKTIDDIKELVMQLVPAKRLQIAKDLLDRLGVGKLSEIPADKLDFAYSHFHKFFEV